MDEMVCGCEFCLMCDGGACRDPDSDYFHGPCPDVPCGLYEDIRQLSFFDGGVMA